MTVTIYSTPTCTYCKLAKEYFNQHQVAYQEFDVAADIEKRKEMVDKSGQLGVPVIDINGQIAVKLLLLLHLHQKLPCSYAFISLYI
jgi:glutaredoxin 3